MSSKQKVATQVDAEVLAKAKAIAHAEGRHLQSVFEEALLDLIEKKEQTRPRSHVVAHYRNSIAQFSELYKRLSE